MKLQIALVSLCSFLATTAIADIYKYVDPVTGAVTYTNEPKRGTGRLTASPSAATLPDVGDEPPLKMREAVKPLYLCPPLDTSPPGSPYRVDTSHPWLVQSLDSSPPRSPYRRVHTPEVGCARINSDDRVVRAIFDSEYLEAELAILAREQAEDESARKQEFEAAQLARKRAREERERELQERQRALAKQKSLDRDAKALNSAFPGACAPDFLHDWLCTPRVGMNIARYSGILKLRPAGHFEDARGRVDRWVGSGCEASAKAGVIVTVACR